MGHKGGQKFAGAQGRVEPLDIDLALARTTDGELQDQLEEAALSKAREIAVEKAPGMMGVLVEVAEDPKGVSTPASRVSAAKEVLAHAEGRPSTQKPEERDQGQQLTVLLVEYKIDGTKGHREIDVTPPEEIRIPVAPGAIELETDDYPDEGLDEEF